MASELNIVPGAGVGGPPKTLERISDPSRGRIGKRWDVNTRPRIKPRARKPTEILFIKPMPASTPKASQRRDSPCKSARTAIHESTAQKKMSKPFME